MSISTSSIINNEYLYPLKKIIISSTQNMDINNLLKVDCLKSLIEGQKVFENKFGKSIKNISGFFCKRKNIDAFLTEKIKNSNFNKDYSSYLQETYNTKSSEEVIKFLFLEYFILIDLFNLRLISELEFKNYLSFNSEKEKFFKNSNLLVANKQAFELTMETTNKFISGKNKELKKQIVLLIKTLGIPLVEIPQFYNLESLIKFLNEVKEIKENLAINTLSFKLRFKKIKHFKKDGMYIVNEKTIIVDPRKPKAFIHELGHYIFEENIKININFTNIDIKKNNIQKSKFEDYSIESELFACTFEQLFI